jgi:hypothetical protein
MEMKKREEPKITESGYVGKWHHHCPKWEL